MNADPHGSEQPVSGAAGASDGSGLGELTWPGLLAQWTRFAQASVAFPKTAEGDRWRAATPAIIALQAVALALAELERLPVADRALAIDRAEVLIRRHAGELRALFGTPAGELGALLADARAAAVKARESLASPKQ